MLIKTVDVRCLKRLIKALSYIVNDVYLSMPFFKIDNFVKCHINANFEKHCEITFRNLFKFLYTVISLNLLINE